MAAVHFRLVEVLALKRLGHGLPFTFTGGSWTEKELTGCVSPLWHTGLMGWRESDTRPEGWQLNGCL